MNNLFTITGFRRYFANTSWLIAEKIFRLAVGLFVGVWVARFLGPEQFGTLSYAQAFVGLFGAFATLGMDGIVIKHLVKDEGNRDLLLGTTFTLKLLGAMVALVIIGIVTVSTSNDNKDIIIITIIASALVFQSLNVIDFYFQSKVLSRYIVLVNLISQLIASLIRIALILTNAPLIAFAYVILFDAVILAVGYIYVYKHKNLSFRQWKFNKLTASEILKYSWPLALSGIVISIYMKIDQIMIKEMLGKTSVGHYAAAVKISEAWYFVTIAINSSLFPAIINAKKRSLKEFYDRLKILYSFMLLSAVAISIPTTIYSKYIVNLLYKEQFDQASTVLMFHIWAGVLVSLGVVTSSIVIANNKQNNALISTSIGAISNIILNLLMIPSFGIIGAAFTTILSQIISGLIVPIYFRVDPYYPRILMNSIWALPRELISHFSSNKENRIIS